MLLEFFGGKLDGTKQDISKDMDDPKIMSITYKTEDEIYQAKKFHGEWMLCYIGKVKKK